MGCFSSKSLDEDQINQAKDGQEKKGEQTRSPQELGIRPEVQFALKHKEEVGGGRNKSTTEGRERSTRTSQPAVVLGRPDDKSFSVPMSPASRTSRNDRNSRMSRKSLVAADLESIMDNQGLLNPIVSRQMSVMSHYSVRSESGAVLISPEENDGSEFKLLKLIGRGGFGNVYLGDWDGDKVAIKVRTSPPSASLCRLCVEGELSISAMTVDVCRQPLTPHPLFQIIQGYHNSDQPEEQEWEQRKERMAQMEAVLMSAIEHDNIVRTFKVIAHQV